jgi:cytochrome c biogenesis protein CcdA
MSYFLLGLLSVVCVELFFILRLPEKIVAMARVSRDSIGVLVSSELSDTQKEIAARKGSLDLLKATFVFSARFSLICIVVYLAYLLAAELLPDQRVELLRILASPIGLVTLTVATACYVWVRNAVRQKL